MIGALIMVAAVVFAVLVCASATRAQRRHDADHRHPHGRV